MVVLLTLDHIKETLMSRNSSDQLPRNSRWFYWLPLASLIGIELYIRNFDGWGAWASAPLLLVPAIISLPIVILGLSECAAAIRARSPLFTTVFYTLVAAIPIVWLGIRRFFM
jgi:hypothetical protein